MLKQLREYVIGKTTRVQRMRIRGYLSHNLRGLQHAVYGALIGSNLKALAAAYGSDKWTLHNYTDHYDFHFRPLRRRRLTVLEIGIGGYDDPALGGGSLRMWRTYFPRSRIYGIDIHDKSSHDERRIKTFRGSQVDAEFLARVLAQTGDPDIIIDDGSHQNEHVLRTFAILFPRLRGSGYYVIEDTQTAYWEEYGGSSTELDRADTSIGFFKSLIDGLNYEEIRDPGRTPSPYEMAITGLYFYHNMVFVRKGRNREVTDLSAADRALQARMLGEDRAAVGPD